MQDTTDKSLDREETEHAPTPEFLRLLHSPLCVSTNPSGDPVGRPEFELLNDVTGRELGVLRTSPCPPRINAPGPTEAPMSHDELLARRHAQRAPRVRKAKLMSSFLPLERASDRQVVDDFERVVGTTALLRWGTNPPVDRVGRLELLNDGTARPLRVYRKSPCPPR
jgi:hypothetical protein